MSKVSVDDKMRIQTLCEQRLGYHAIAAKYIMRSCEIPREELEDGHCEV